MIRQQILFTGRVQGVFFRATTAELASKRALTGWVRNLPDGAVELEAQGDADEINTLLAQISAHYESNITGQQVGEIDCCSQERGFRVRH